MNQDLTVILHDAPKRVEMPAVGFLVTNHLNIMYMLSAGMVMPPSGFDGKYYSDSLEYFPGWIPLFVDEPPREEIEHSVKEAGYLRPCIAKISLAELSGPVMASGSSSKWRKLRFPDQFEDADRVLLFPAPLPVSRIVAIVFQSRDDKLACEADAKNYDNVLIEEFKREIKHGLFKGKSDLPWPPDSGPMERFAPLQGPLAAGGVMAMLLLFANLGSMAVRGCHVAFDPDESEAEAINDSPVLIGLESWVRQGEATLPPSSKPDPDQALHDTSQAKLLWDAVASLVDWRNGGMRGSAEYLLIEFLSEAIAGLEPQLKPGVSELRDTLESLTGLADVTASELFDRHDTPLARALILFLLRRDCADLFSYESDQLTEEDWIVSAILFGVRDGWMKLPCRLRAGRKLSDAVSHRMASLSHRIAGTELDLGTDPDRILPLRELFGDGSTWRAAEESAALTLARLQKWDCIHTRIILRRGEYTLIVKEGSTHIELTGEPRISPKIDLEHFFALFARARLDHATEDKVRKKLPR